MKDIRRDEVDYLPEDRVYCLRCFWWFLFLHNPVGYRITPPVATLNIHPIANAVRWDAIDKEYGNDKKTDGVFRRGDGGDGGVGGDRNGQWDNVDIYCVVW